MCPAEVLRSPSLSERNSKISKETKINSGARIAHLLLPLRVILRGIAFPAFRTTLTHGKESTMEPFPTDLFLNVHRELDLSSGTGKQDFVKNGDGNFSAEDSHSAYNHSSLYSEIGKKHYKYVDASFTTQQELLEHMIEENLLLELERSLTEAILHKAGVNSDTLEYSCRSSFSMQFYVNQAPNDEKIESVGTSVSKNIMVPLFPRKKGNDGSVAMSFATINFFRRAMINASPSSCCDTIIKATSQQLSIAPPELYIIMRIRGGKGKAGFQKQLKKKGRDYYRRAVVSAQHRAFTGEGSGSNEGNDTSRKSSVFERGTAAVLSRLMIHKTNTSTASTSSRFLKSASSANRWQKHHRYSNNGKQKTGLHDSRGHPVKQFSAAVEHTDDPVARDIIDEQHRHRQELHKWRHLLYTAAKHGMTVICHREISSDTAPSLESSDINNSHVRPTK